MSGKGCACTPRSLLVPAGGVKVLDPSLRVSSEELLKRDREWQQQRQLAETTSAKVGVTATEQRGRPAQPASDQSGHGLQRRSKLASLRWPFRKAVK
ncbi:uncharacterized protein PFL1_06853 [Pseudozyma flocculosa PF-1]|uniref:uncharacterized protein n=1 Tax=Pseudozyma flocculosa PF-1 TaxID=1277687 RepID=UPI0004561149|nr:uncharacterized protein PFL1_06853 [Pseudozyma flocculosa PF-1]EPQ30154.1 hypothetical protein PFL1_06853 [Pseudozyma flocculosa PF-1]